jgi:hypothetical protein
MSTTFIQAFEERTKELLATKDGKRLLFDTAAKLRDGYYDARDTLFIYSNFHDAFPIDDALPFLAVWNGIHRGDIAVCDLYIGSGPFGDLAADGNQETLAAALGRGLVMRTGDQLALSKVTFTTKVVSGTSGEDGAIVWHEPLEFCVFQKGKFKRYVSIPPQWAALEIGKQAAAKTFFQIGHDRPCLARWPYHSDTIRIFYPMPGWLMQKGGQAV